MEESVKELVEQFVTRNGYSEEKALEVAKLNVMLVDKMKDGIVEFYFKKKDGSIRQSFGTLKEDLLPPVEEGNSGDRKPCPTVQVYWDTEKSAWRSFTKSNLVSIES